jgi:hypothetical protein
MHLSGYGEVGAVARCLAVFIVVVVSAVATWLELHRPNALTVDIGSAMPFPDPEDRDNVLGDRYWMVDPEVTVRLKRACEGIRVTTRASARSNGRPVPGWGDPSLGGGGEEAPGRRQAGFALRVPESAYGLAGYTIEFRSSASCRIRGRTESASATRVFRLPAASCWGGPLRVFGVRGAVEVTDDDWDVPDTYPLREGYLVRPGWGIQVPRDGEVLLGAPECNGFRVKLGPGRHFTGGYDTSGRGAGFETTEAEMTGDVHAGGLQLGATVEPLGFRCRTCPTPVPATFAGRRVSATRNVVRVSAGVVEARAGEGRGTLVRPGQQVSITCRSEGRCSLVGLRPYQPNEPWSSPVFTGEGPFVDRVVTRPGERPARRLLAPARAQTQVIVLPAGGRVPEQLFVVWSRMVRGRLTVPTQEESFEQGVLLWESSTSGGRSVWRVAYERKVAPYDYVSADAGDMSGDGHPEVMFAGLRGSGGCGVTRLLVTTEQGVKEALRHEGCETRSELSGRVFHLREPVGRCPYRQSGAHCYGGVRDAQMRWNGRKLVTVRTVVLCTLARLNPKRGCEPRS